MEALTVSGTILSDDWVAAARLHHRTSRIVWLVFWPLVGLLLVSGVIRAIGITTVPDPTLFLVAAVVALLPLGRSFGIQRRAQRLFAETRSRSATLDISFVGDGLTVRSSHGSSTIAWSDLHKWRAGPEHVLLYLNSAQYFILPRRLFPDERSMTAVEQQLLSTVGQAA
jgi:hypothetical protein